MQNLSYWFSGLQIVYNNLLKKHIANGIEQNSI